MWHNCAKSAVEILGHAVGDRAVEIGSEPRGHVGIDHRVSVQGRQIGLQIVAAKLAELGGEILRPGQLAGLPTVGPEIGQPPAGLLRFFQRDLSEIVEIVVQRGRIHIVDLITRSAGKGVAHRIRLPLAAGQRVAGSQNRPLALGHVPLEVPVGSPAIGDVDDVFGVDGRRIVATAKRLDHDVAVIAVDSLGLGKLAGELLRSLQLQFRLHDLFHRVLLRDPGPHHDPAAGHVEPDFELQAIRFLHGMAEQFPPLGTEKLDARQRMIARIAARANQIDAADSLRLEFLQVAGNAFLVDAIEQPPPIDRRLRRGRRIGKALFEILFRRRCAWEKRKGAQRNQ